MYILSSNWSIDTFQVQIHTVLGNFRHTLVLYCLYCAKLEFKLVKFLDTNFLHKLVIGKKLLSELLL